MAAEDRVAVGSASAISGPPTMYELGVDLTG